MIHPAEVDIVPLVQNLVQSLKGYAAANEVTIYFGANMDQLSVELHPFNLIQSLTLIICKIINLVPHKSEIYVRLHACSENNLLFLEVENTGINLMPVKQISNQCIYSFIGLSLTNGTLFRLTLPLHRTALPLIVSEEKNTISSNLPQYYAEVRKRLRSYFTQAEKLVASLSHSCPKDAAFLQKINALITANLEDEQFNTNVLCKAMAMSRTQLFRRLKPLIRQAPAHYIKTMRLQRAKELLQTTDMTVGEIAFKTGFQSQSHFTKVFMEQYDVLPSVYRRKNIDATNE